MKDFTECGSITYYRVRDRFVHGKFNCGKLFSPKMVSQKGINLYINNRNGI